MHCIIIDAHIHIHECYDLSKFFNSAKSNFLKQLKNLDPDSFQSVLCLTESNRVNYFNELVKKYKTNKKIANWKIDSTPNENVLCLTDEDSFRIFLVAGRQIVTKENLEVLALGLIEDPEDGKPIDEVIKYVNENISLSVIPWGVGKWTGRRKEVLKEIILRNHSFPIYLGDNGNRPWFMRKSKLFDLAYSKGIRNLPGSDPLPFSREVQKPGSFGFVMNGIINEDDPFDSICKIIKNNSTTIKTFGKLESLVPFLKNQFAMQIVKRKRKKINL